MGRSIVKVFNTSYSDPLCTTVQIRCVRLHASSFFVVYDAASHRNGPSPLGTGPRLKTTAGLSSRPRHPRSHRPSSPGMTAAQHFAGDHEIFLLLKIDGLSSPPLTSSA